MIKNRLALSLGIASCLAGGFEYAETIEKFDWDSVIITPTVADWWLKGRQVLNFYPCDKDYRDSKEASAFVEQHLKDAAVFDVDAAILKFAVEQASLDGLYLEMGVCTGRTINFIAALAPTHKVYGFDSFEGLPDNWVRSDASVPEGTFAIVDKNWIPPVLHNVTLVKGRFRDTLPSFKKDFLQDKPIAFLHIDCDIYISTKEIFDALGDRIVAGTIIAFDELYNYPGAAEHEWKALQEFLNSTGKKIRFLAYNQYFEQAVVQVVE